MALFPNQQMNVRWKVVDKKSPLQERANPMPSGEKTRGDDQYICGIKCAVVFSDDRKSF